MIRLNDAIWKSVTWAMLWWFVAWRMARRVAIFFGLLFAGLCLLPFACLSAAFAPTPAEPAPELGHGSVKFENAYAYAAARARGRAA